MNADTGLPRYSVAELNQAIGSLLERGFAPRFLLEATVSRPQLKKGHLWLTLVDEQAAISAVVRMPFFHAPRSRSLTPRSAAPRSLASDAFRFSVNHRCSASATMLLPSSKVTR